jgi:hypothetical protein
MTARFVRAEARREVESELDPAGEAISRKSGGQQVVVIAFPT